MKATRKVDVMSVLAASPTRLRSWTTSPHNTNIPQTPSAPNNTNPAAIWVLTVLLASMTHDKSVTHAGTSQTQGVCLSGHGHIWQSWFPNEVDLGDKHTPGIHLSHLGCRRRRDFHESISRVTQSKSSYTNSEWRLSDTH